MIFVFDLDDTVCETDSYSEQYILNFFKENSWPYKQIAKTVRYAEKKFDWDHQTALKWYKEYGDQMMLEFPCKPNAISTINSLYELGHTIIIATARATDWHTNPEDITKKWLANNGIKYNKLYIGRFDKEVICKEVNADVFIDDDISITGRVANYFSNFPNKKTFLMNTDYNSSLKEEKNVIRVTDFTDFLTKFI